MAARRVAAAAGLLLLFAATPTLAPAGSPWGAKPEAAEGGRVLILSSREWPAIAQLRAELAAGGRGEPRLPPIAADLVKVTNVDEVRRALRRLKPELHRYRAVFTLSQSWARAAQGEVPSQMPIVFDGVDDPVALCLVDRLSRPGRNATGHMHLLHGSEDKMLQTLRDAFPDLREVVYLLAFDNVGSGGCEDGSDAGRPAPAQPCRAGLRPLDAYVRERTSPQLHERAERMGLKLNYFVFCQGGRFGQLASEARPGVGFLVPWQTLFDNDHQALVDAINATRRPAIYPRESYAQRGGLLVLEVENDLVTERSSVLAMLQVLGGRDPATLPVTSPRGMRLIVNAVTAQRIGAHPSLSVLRRADEILRAAPSL